MKREEHNHVCMRAIVSSKLGCFRTSSRSLEMTNTTRVRIERHCLISLSSRLFDIVLVVVWLSSRFNRVVGKGNRDEKGV